MEKEIKEIEVTAAEVVKQEVKVEKKKKSTKKVKAEIAKPEQDLKVVRVLSKTPGGFRVLLSSGKIAKITKAEYKRLK